MTKKSSWVVISRSSWLLFEQNHGLIDSYFPAGSIYCFILASTSRIYEPREGISLGKGLVIDTIWTTERSRYGQTVNRLFWGFRKYWLLINRGFRTDRATKERSLSLCGKNRAQILSCPDRTNAVNKEFII